MEINLKLRTIIYFYFRRMLYFIKCIMFANSSVVSFLLILLWGLMSLHRSSSCLYNCPNVLAYSGCRWWTYSRLIFSNCSPQNVSYWMRRASDTDANIIFVMPKDWRFFHTLTTMIGITARGQVSLIRQWHFRRICERSTYHREIHLTHRLHVFSIMAGLEYGPIYISVKT